MPRESTVKVPAFYRFLHASYRRGAQVSHFVSSRVTNVGWMALSLLVLAAVLGGDVGRSRLYQVFSLIFALVAVGMLWAWTRRARLSARRFLPRHATAGEPCTYTVEVQNDGKRGARGFWLLERPPDPRPGLLRFHSTPEPGEEKRNAFDRLFVYYRWRWLLERNLMFGGGKSEAQVFLRPGESKRVRMTIVPKRRGVVRFDDLRAVLPDPFGLFQRCRWVLAMEDTLVVLPKRYRLPPLDLPGSACFQIGGEAVSNTIGLSGEFLGLREYRPGDAMRHIHWKSWAKTGEPIVKEFEDTYFPRYGLVLDNFVDPGDEELFEEAVSVAASFAVSIDTKRSLLDLMFVKEEAIVVTAGRGLARAEKMLEMLAAVEAEPVEKLEALLRLVRRYQGELTACLCVFTGWTEERAEFVRSLARGGTELIALVVCRSEEEGRRLLAEYPVPCRVLLLEHERVQEGLMAL